VIISDDLVSASLYKLPGRVFCFAFKIILLIYKAGQIFASTKEATPIGRISDVVRSGRGPGFVA